MSHALAFLPICALLAITLATALGGINGLIDRKHNVSNSDMASQTRKRIATTWTTHAIDQFMAAQLAKQLLKIGERDTLSLADACERHRSTLLAQRKIDHRGYGETPFCRQTHDSFLAKGESGRIAKGKSDQFGPV
ncbi:protein of unknown function [Alcaligenes faecalis subsp. faecalis]|nr:protein of unknown function [Alcaligenes faecalis subsp. faecalis]